MNQFKSLIEFKDFKHSYYRSSDPLNTAVYFSDFVSDVQRGSPELFLELLIIHTDSTFGKTLLKMPNSDYFVELFGGSGSARGSMKRYSAVNAWEKNNPKDVSILCQDNNLLLCFGKYSSDFNFMQLADFHITGEIYLPLPEHVRKVEYVYKRSVASYFVLDYPAYYPEYGKFRFRSIVEGVEIGYEIKGFQRARDGGSTYLTLVGADGKIHKFYAPSPLANPKGTASWDGTPLEEVVDDERNAVLKRLEIEEFLTDSDS